MVRTRFAPSPTGSLHMGGARTALYNYLLAKRHGGEFILRIEDTDKERNTQSSQEQLIAELKWLGLTWDEGPSEAGKEQGKYGPYQQSHRSDIYQKYATDLVAAGQAFYCFATEEEIQQQHDNTPERHTFKFQSPYRDWSVEQAEDELAKGTKAVIRFKNTHEDDVFDLQDCVRGHVALPGNMIGDFIILRNDGSPVYNFCCAIDDALMQITHVLRGEEHLPNTLRQMMITQALGFDSPIYGHLSLILDQDGKKLSKRSGASSVSDFMQLGFVPEGLLNYLALLGWSDPEHREILTIEEMIQVFSTDRLNPAAPMYDPDKLRWVNFKHLHNYPHDKLWELSAPYMQEAGLVLPQDPSWHTKALDFFSQDFHTLADSKTIFKPFDRQPIIIDDTALSIVHWPDSKRVLIAFLRALYAQHPAFEQGREAQLCAHICQQLNADASTLDAIETSNNPSLTPADVSALMIAADENTSDFLAEDVYTSIVKDIQKQTQIKGKLLFKPIRVAMTASADGPDLKQVIQLVDLTRLITRVEYAVCCCFLTKVHDAG